MLTGLQLLTRIIEIQDTTALNHYPLIGLGKEITNNMKLKPRN